MTSDHVAHVVDEQPVKFVAGEDCILGALLHKLRRHRHRHRCGVGRGSHGADQAKDDR
jgi:hypothetical protein